MINLLNFQKAATTTVAVFLFLGLSAQDRNFSFSFENNPQARDFGKLSIVIPIDLSGGLENLNDAEIKKIFRIYVGDELPDDKSIPSIAGGYEIQEGHVVFRPRFDPPPGITYTAVFDLIQAYQLSGTKMSVDLPTFVQETFVVPKLGPLSGEAIAAIYPTSDTVPANWLRLYVYFEQSMGLDNPHDHVWLQDEGGQVISTPFVEITEGLWNARRTRLTLFFHPGRVKRGVGPNMTMGTVLQPGKNYQLTFDPEWKDALGRAIKSRKTKVFFVEAADRKTITPGRWIITLPQSGTSDVLQVLWPEPLDHALVKRMIRVIYNEKEIEAIPELSDQERQLNLRPTSTWQSGKYFIEVDPLLEDLAGNTAFHLFDTATKEGYDPAHKEPAGSIRIPFVIK